MSGLGVPFGERGGDSVHGKDTSHESRLNTRGEEINEHFFFRCSTEGNMVLELSDIGLQREFFRDMGGDEPVSGFALDIGVYECCLEFFDEVEEISEVWYGSF